MITYEIISIIASTIAVGAYGYIYWKCGKLATLSIVLLTILELGYLFIGKYTYYFLPIEIAVLIWCTYVVFKCGIRNIQYGMIISVILIMGSRILFESKHFLGCSVLLFLPVTIWWYKDSCLPKQQAHEKRLWG